MTESKELIKYGRELLMNLEAEGKYVFHGSENAHIQVLEPRQAFTLEEGVEVEDDKPAVHATPFADIAILMALINMKNCPEGFESGFEFTDKIELRVDKQGIDQLVDSAKGYVYVLSKDDFAQRGPSQVISFKTVKPIQVIEVKKEDLSPDIIIE